MPGKMKRSEEFSIVPQSIRDKVGGRVSAEDRAVLARMAEEGSPRMRSEATEYERARRNMKEAYDEAQPSMNPLRNVADIVTGRAGEQADRLAKSTTEFNRVKSETGYAKGGMVKGYAKGGMVTPRGFGKARNKPCKLS